MLQAAVDAAGGKSYVPVEILQRSFTTLEWENLGQDDSTLVKFLNSDLISDQKDASLVSIERLKVFGLLNCTSSLDVKINCFTEIVK